MNYAEIQKSSFVNGEGCRVVLWVVGCDHQCSGCHNKYLWDPTHGQSFGPESMNELLKLVNRPHVDGLTLSGGDPMYPPNRAVVTEIAKMIKEKTGKSIWMYTGYKLSEIAEEPIMQYVDVVVDGRFIKELQDENYKWAGSTNQRIWFKDNNVWKYADNNYFE